MKIRVLPKLLACVLCLATLLLLPVTASAAEEGSISIMYHHDEQPIENAVFRLYNIASMDNNGKYLLTDTFSSYPVSIEKLDNDSLMALASTLAAYVERDNIFPDAQAVTNKYGGFRVNRLKTGLYLIVGDSVESGNAMYFAQPFIVSLPGKNANGNVIYDVAAEVKYELRNSDAEPLERKALKIWDDKGNENRRPKNITVQLLRDGVVFDEVVLNSGNNWRHTWTNLDVAYNWQLTEKNVADGYYVTVEQQGVTFTVTNTYNGPNSPNNDNTTPTNPKPTGNSNNGNTGNNLKNNSNNESRLPQTGMLWWPVPVLFCVGLIVLIVGIVLRKRRDNHYE